MNNDPLLNERITAVINNQSDMQLVAQATSGSNAKDSMPDGAVKHLHVVVHAARDEATRGTDYVGAVTDLTAVKESRLALEKAYAEIQSLKDELQRENIVLREEVDK